MKKQGKVIEIYEGASGNDIYLIKVENLGTVESRGFINGRDGLFIDIGDYVEFDLSKNSINDIYYAKNLSLLN